MLKNYISSVLRQNFEYEPTTSQKKAFSDLSEFIGSSIQDEIFLLKGYAGTGKTTLINTLVKSLSFFKIKTFLLAPTGRAAKVVSSYTHQKAYTVHKKIYRQKAGISGFGNFDLNKNLHTDTFFIVDEASMIANGSSEMSAFGSGRLLDDLMEFVYSGTNCKLMLVGDSAQLPPVGLAESPALDVENLKTYGFRVYHLELTDVVRQTEASGILKNATYLRNFLLNFESTNPYPKLKTNGLADVKNINGTELIEEISTAYCKYGMDQTIILSRSNKRTIRFNNGIRNTILYREEELSNGDFLMVVKNNYHWVADFEETDFIANGDICEITRIKRYEELYGYRFADVDIRFLDYENLEVSAKIILDSLTVEAAALSIENTKKLYEEIEKEYLEIPQKRLRYLKIKENPYFNAMQVKFAYAVTCHKAQGGQWKAVFIDQGFINDEMINKEYIRWLYTAITRATEVVYLVNFNEKFFE